MADVYVARQGGAGGFDKLVALKFLRDQGDDVGSRDMFMQELSTAALLNHPSIVQTFDAGEIEGRMYMAMEFINGETLSRFHRAVMKRTETFAVDLAIHIVRELANALDYAHLLTTLDGEPLGLVHRDISPSNVLLSVDGGVKLLDFGIARVTTRLRATEVGVIKGKFAYMAPEQAAGEPIDRRVDIYALGILLWQLLVGKQAFDADSDAALMHQVLHPALARPSELGAGSPALDAIVMRALAPKARDRYATAGELATDLSAYLATIAPGYEGGKVIRDHMAECFAEKKEKLARVIKGVPEQEMSFDEIDMLSGSQINTPSPRVMFTPAREPSAEISVSNVERPRPPAPARRRRGVLLIGALVALAAPAVIAWKLVLDRDPAPGPQVAAPPPASVAAAIVEPPPPAPAPAPEVVPVAAPIAPAIKTTAPPPRTPPKRTPPKRPREAIEVAQRAPVPEPVKAEPVPVPAPAPVEPKPVVPIAVAPAPVPVLPPPAARVSPGSLDAVPSIASISVDGPLPDSEIRSAVERVLGSFRDCYRAAAKQAGKTPALKVKVTFGIDENRAVQNLRVSGDALGVGACVKDAASSLRTRVAPDVGTAGVSVVIKFAPVGG